MPPHMSPDPERASRWMIGLGAVLLAWAALAVILTASTGTDPEINSIMVVMLVAGGVLLGAGLLVRYRRP